MTTGQDVAREAFEKLQKTIKPSDDHDFARTTVEEVKQAIMDVQRTQEARSDLRFTRRIEPFIDTINSYSEILTILCQGWPPMSFIWGPIRFILLLARNYINIIDTILEAYQQIADNLPRIDQLRKTFPENQRLLQTVGWIYSDLLEFHGKAYKMFQRRIWHFYFAFDWGLYQRKFKSVLEKLSRHCENVEKEAAATHFTEMRSFRDRKSNEDKEFEDRRRIRMFQEVLSWLSESEDSQEEYLHKLSDARQHNTCNWILKDPGFVGWIEGRSRRNHLWISGKPGSGKSFHASLIVQHIQNCRSDHCAFFFCRYDSSANISCAKILRTFSRQLLSENAELNPDLASLVHEAFLQKGSCKTTTALKKLIMQILPELQLTQFVLDGVDELELEVQKELLKALDDLMKSRQDNMGLLISSRREPQIQKFTFCAEIKLEDKTKHSLALYIQNTVNTLKDNHTYIDAPLSDEIQTHLSEKADGMFLWVRLVFSMLNERGSENEMRAAINILPDDLDQAYGRIIDRIQQKFKPYSRRQVLKILSWLCVGRRLLSIHEVVDGIALDFERRDLSRHTRISNPDRYVLDLCAPLLEKSQSGVLGLVHFSAKEYLLSSQSGTKGPFLEEGLAHFGVAQSCIINLISALDFIPKYSNLSEIELQVRTVGGQYGLVSYAFEFWVDHLLSYLSESEKFGSERKQNILLLLRALHRLMKRPKEPGVKAPVLCISSELSKGLRQLEHEHDLYFLVASCLEIPVKLRQVKASFDDPDKQEEQLSLMDDTCTTFIACQLRGTTDQILKMPISPLPPHIDNSDYEYFVNRFDWKCKYLGCGQGFKSELDKKRHERSHVISFPCPHCDFFFNGFRSKKDLDKHVRNYHLDLNDFEVPESLHLGDDSALGGSRANFLQKRARKCWNQRGRKASQTGMKQILKCIRITANDDPKIDKSQQLAIDSLERNIDESHYVSLTSFKQDVREAMEGAQGEDDPTFDQLFESACRYGLRNTMVEYPGFANLQGHPTMNGAFEYRNPVSAENLNGMGSWNAESHTAISLSEEKLRKQEKSWSKVEKSEFPDLLKTYGKDFDTIAEQLGTRSCEDVEAYYTSLIKQRPELEVFAPQSDLKSRTTEQKDHVPVADLVQNMRPTPGFSLDPAAAFATPSAASGNIASTRLLEPTSSRYHQQYPTTDTPSHSLGQAAISSSKIPVRKKRVRRKAYCTDCNDRPDGFYSETSLEKHVDRFHRPNRKVWICNDLSSNKSFFRDCLDCRVGKRYKTKDDASYHLREVHFSWASTSQTLHRWLLEDEEPNPSYRSMTEARESAAWPNAKRPKIHDQIAPLTNVLQRKSLLPPMRTHREKDKVDNGKPTGGDWGEPSTGINRSIESLSALSTDDESSNSNSRAASRVALPRGRKSSEKSLDLKNGTYCMMVTDSRSDTDFKSNANHYEDIVLPNVSFDNMIGMRETTSKDYDPNGPPHRSRLALIKPDQVSRLPHLDQARKLVCSDQVSALYDRLDDKEMTREYSKHLEKLEELSRFLLGNLKDWQRERSLAPRLPYSLN